MRNSHTYMALGCPCAFLAKGSAILQPFPRVIRQALLLCASCFFVPFIRQIILHNGVIFVHYVVFSPFGVIAHPGLRRLELTSMLVYCDSSVRLPPEVTVSTTLVVTLPGEVLTHRTDFATLEYIQPRHFGQRPHRSTTIAR